MKPERKFLLRKFDEYNALIFRNTLPKVPIVLTESKSFLGMCAYKRKLMPNGEFQNCDFTLRFNTRLDLPQEEIEDTLIHEMIHYHILSKQWKDTSIHGKIFRNTMDYINGKYNRHVSIRHKLKEEEKEQLADKKRRWHVIAVVDYSDGKCAVKVLPRIRDSIDKFHNAYSRSRGVVKVSFYFSDNSYFNRYPCSSALRAYVCVREEIMAELDPEKEYKIGSWPT